MAAPTQAGLTPAEIAFLCEMESVTIIPRQRLDSIPLLGGSTPALRPPHRSTLPLWLALLLKRQRRCSIVPPPWLSATALTTILDGEIGGRTQNGTSAHNDSQYRRSPALGTQQNQNQLPQNNALALFTPTVPLSRTASAPTPPFQTSSLATTTTSSSDDTPSLPYHWLELSHLLLTHASDDIPDSAQLTRLLRDLREVRQAKLRSITANVSSGAGVQLTGIGAMELGEGRAFLTGVVEGLRKLGASREGARREEWEEGGGAGGGRALGDDDDEDMEM